MDEGSRRVVEQLPVVHAQDEPAAGGALGQRLAGAAQQLDAVAGGRQQRREGAERDRAGGA